MAETGIVIRGAREHNLRDVSLVLPRGKLICLTGVSGSGKSSLAFDTLYAEGQRRYVESLSSYARQFLGQMPKPEVDRIDGLSPSISIQQKTGGRNPRSTVGTITEINDYLRVLYARVGQGHCPSCGRPVAAQTREQIVARVLEELPAGTSFLVLAPVVRGQKGEYKDLFADLAKAGYVRARVNGQVVNLTDDLALDRQIKHQIEVVIDRLKAGPSLNSGSGQRGRLVEAVEQALVRGEGSVIIAADARPDWLLSSNYACTSCGIGFEPPSPQLFSFNSPQGMCLACDGLGIRHDFDPELLVPDPSLSVWDGAIAPLGPVKEIGRWRRHIFEGVAANIEADPGGPPKGSMLKGPWRKLDDKSRRIWLYGTGDRQIVFHWKNKSHVFSHGEKWAGVANDLLTKYRGASGGPIRASSKPFMRSMVCPECSGARLNPRARAVKVGGKDLVEVGTMPIGQASQFFDEMAGIARPDNSNGSSPSAAPEVVPLDAVSRTIAEELLKEIRARLRFLTDVGLDYLTLDRAAPTLSGGEAQRIRLASQVGAGLVGVLYILDEPSIGLHPRDNERLLFTLRRLAELGNTVVVVEHDEETMRAADHLVDFGPGPGVKGGEVVAQGTIDDLAKSPQSLTGQYLAGKKAIAVPTARKVPDGRSLTIEGARQNNLKNIDVEFPLGLFICVTGVSGSGKSSLVGDILREALARDLNGAITDPGLHDRIEGLEHLDKVIDIDQSPIGRTPRSNPATYIKLFDLIRDLYTQLPEAKAAAICPAGSASTSPVVGARRARATGRTAWKWTSLPTSGSPARSARESGSAARLSTFDSRGRASATCSTWTCKRPSSTSPTSPSSPGCSRPCTTSVSITSSSARRRRRSPAARPSGSSWPASWSRRGTGKTLVHPRRADHGSPFRRRPQAAGGAARFHRVGKHGRRDRAQPGRRQDGRLDHRPGARRGLRGWPDRRPRHAGDRGQGRGESHRASPAEATVPAGQRMVDRGRKQAGAATAQDRERPGGHRGPRRPTAQPQGDRPGYPPQPDDGLQRAQRLGQELAGDRHALCRGPAALRREPVELRPAIPGPFAKAQGRADQRAVAGDLHRAEDNQQEPAVDRGHRHRDPRLFAHLVRSAGASVLPQVRHGDRHADRRRDRRAGPPPARGDQGLRDGPVRTSRRRVL